MLDALLASLLVTLAARAALDAWFEGSIFATARAYAEAWKYSDTKVTALFGELLSCRFCLGFHVTFWLAVLCCIAGISWLLLVPVALAARALEFQIYLELKEEDEPGTQA